MAREIYYRLTFETPVGSTASWRQARRRIIGSHLYQMRTGVRRGEECMNYSPFSAFIPVISSVEAG
jgi:hypothetical protein